MKRILERLKWLGIILLVILAVQSILLLKHYRQKLADQESARSGQALPLQGLPPGGQATTPAPSGATDPSGQAPRGISTSSVPLPMLVRGLHALQQSREHRLSDSQKSGILPLLKDLRQWYVLKWYLIERLGGLLTEKQRELLQARSEKRRGERGVEGKGGKGGHRKAGGKGRRAEGLDEGLKILERIAGAVPAQKLTVPESYTPPAEMQTDPPGQLFLAYLSVLQESPGAAVTAAQAKTLLPWARALCSVTGQIRDGEKERLASMLNLLTEPQKAYLEESRESARSGARKGPSLLIEVERSLSGGAR